MHFFSFLCLWLLTAQQICTPTEHAKIISKTGCPDLHDSYQCGDLVETVEYVKGDSCQGVWHIDWKFEAIDDSLVFVDVKKASPATKDGEDVVFQNKFQLHRWSSLRSVRELEVALAKLESGEIAVGSWRDEPELTIEHRIGVLESVAEAYAFYGHDEDAKELREKALALSQRRNLGTTVTKKLTMSGIEFCGDDSDCSELFKIGLNALFELSISNTQDFCTKPEDKLDHTPLSCCGGNQCLFYCMANNGDSCAEFWAPKEPVHCCDGYDYNSQSLRCYDEKRVCPPGMTSCSLVGIFAPAAHCSRGAAKCWEKIGEMVYRVADVLVSIGSMVFSAGAATAGKVAVTTGAKAVAQVFAKEAAKEVVKSMAKAAMKEAAMQAFKETMKTIRKEVRDHFQRVHKELMFTYIVEEATMIATAQTAQAEGWITATDVLDIVDPTGIYELVTFFTDMEPCRYVDPIPDPTLRDMREKSIALSQKLTAHQISPYFGTWRGRYRAWVDYKTMELSIGCDGKLTIIGAESQLMLFDEEYVRDVCDSSEPWEFVVNDLWGSDYYDCGYISGILMMQRFDSNTKNKIAGHEFRGTFYGKRSPEIPCEDQRRHMQNTPAAVEYPDMTVCPAGKEFDQNSCMDLPNVDSSFKTGGRVSNWGHIGAGCFRNRQMKVYYNIKTPDNRKDSRNHPIICRPDEVRDEESFVVNFQIEFGAWTTNGCDRHLTRDQCQNLAETEQYTRFSTINNRNYPKACYVDWNGQVFWNSHTSGKATVDTAPICNDKKQNAILTPTGVAVEFGPAATAGCEFYLSPSDCADVGRMMGDTNGLTEYYSYDWPRGCLADFNDDTRFIYNYVPDGGVGEGDIEVAPVCKVCTSGNCGFQLHPSEKNWDVTYYVYKANVIGRNVQTMSYEQVKEFCEDQGLILATPHNGYDINEILKQTTEIMARKSDEIAEVQHVDQPIPWGDDLYFEADYTPQIAIGYSCSATDDCTDLRNWNWEDAVTDMDAPNFGPYHQGTLTGTVRRPPPTVEEQESEFAKDYMEAEACGYYDNAFYQEYVDLVNNHPDEFSLFELNKCRDHWLDMERKITTDLRNEWNRIANGNAQSKDQCGFIDWEGASDGSTTINVGVCDDMDYRVFACNKQTTSSMIPSKSEKRCLGRDWLIYSCNDKFDRDSCLKSTESGQDEEQDCVWCLNGPCTVNAEYRCATKAFMNAEQQALQSNPQSVSVTQSEDANVNGVSTFEVCKIVSTDTAAVESGGNSVVQISSWAYPYALIDGAPGSAGLSPEKRNPDPMQKLGEVQCCNSNNKCTRRNPWNSGSNSDCLSGMNDNTKFTLQEAIDLCASVGQDWSLCTREAIAANICGGKGCNHDYALVWAWDPRAISWVHPYALIDGAPGRGGEVFNPDPMEKLGEVQCCNSNNKCTRRNPWNSGRNSDCLSGMNDNAKFTLQEAIDLCASIGQDWSLCTRQEISNSLCKGKGCNHDTALVWAWDPIATLSKEHTLEMLTGGEALMSLSMKILACIGVVASLRYISGQFMKNSEYATIESHN